MSQRQPLEPRLVAAAEKALGQQKFVTPLRRQIGGHGWTVRARNWSGQRLR